MNKNLGVALVVILVIATAGAYLFLSQKGGNPLGGQPSQVTEGNCLFVDGARICPKTVKMNQASTTVCSFKSPTATSTVRAQATLRTGTTTATFFEWGKATTPTATTTSLGASAVASLGIGTFVASSTAGDFTGGNSFIDPPQVVAPNTWVNLKYGGTLGASNVFAGDCTATFVY